MTASKGCKYDDSQMWRQFRQYEKTKMSLVLLYTERIQCWIHDISQGSKLK